MLLLARGCEGCACPARPSLTQVTREVLCTVPRYGSFLFPPLQEAVIMCGCAWPRPFGGLLPSCQEEHCTGITRFTSGDVVGGGCMWVPQDPAAARRGRSTDDQCRADARRESNSRQTDLRRLQEFRCAGVLPGSLTCSQPHFRRRGDTFFSSGY